ncbi:hypothetical protein PBI_MA5_20 [Mycobacterium phage MA5]|uniref:Head-to-tail connector protein n=1 Tax=Mycobacterium phage MA5 TaxID=2725640 RepID=A0A6M3T1G0_9CAUD|nr:tail completion or Neck1 protein [Mycobacterium phage MA5]QJD52073.1 hypothetical protein PBI_MA5_20 [Mycobacterium phage MA5]
MAKLVRKSVLHHIVSHLDGVKAAVRDATDEGHDKSQARLEAARASTQWQKIYGPDHLTEVTKSYGDVDGFINLEAPNAMAIEFGHQPSGVFEGTDTKAPEGLYIITKGSGAVS